MRKCFETILLSAAIIVPAACTGSDIQEIHAFGLEIVPVPDDAARASYTDELPEEGIIRTIGYIIADSGTGKVVDKGRANCGGVKSFPLDLRLPSGTYDYLVVANGPDISSCAGISDALKTEVPFSEFNNAYNGFCMSETGSFSSDRTKRSAVCHLKRLVCRICLRSLRNALPPELGDFVPEFFAVGNPVTAPMTLGGRLTASPQRGAGSEIRISGISIPPGGRNEWDDPIRQYSYPDHGLPKPTVLTLAGRVGGILYYYPILLEEGGLQSNCTYSLDLTVCGLGSSDPLVPADKGALELSATLQTWHDGYTHSSEI